jgi:DNA repair protein RecO (recombination protein O)
VTSVVTTAIVLHVQNYSESSRILRLATREAGVQSVMARGARASQRRFGSGVDLFAEGEVQYESRFGRDLHTLARFDVVHSRSTLGASLERFEGASGLAEVMLRVAGHDDTPAEAFMALQEGLDSIAAAENPTCATVESIWRLLAALGFTPALDACVHCNREVQGAADAAFSAEAGGVLCDSCVGLVPVRRLPASARKQLREWLLRPAVPDEHVEAVLEPATVRAHRRLLRMFVHAHLTEGRPLRAFDAWANA